MSVSEASQMSGVEESADNNRTQRSPRSGDSPKGKRPKGGPDPAPLAREALQWIIHTLNLEVSRKTHMTVDVTRALLVKLETLNTAVHDLAVTNLGLKI